VVPGRLQGVVRFDGVRFAYPNTVGDPALDRVDVTIEAGETVALVGETGAGKSTLVKLAARFYDPSAGSVSVDGIDLRTIELGTFRRQLGIVPQEAFLFSGTIRDNIAFGRPDATDAEVEAAARAVSAHDFIATLPGLLARLDVDHARLDLLGHRGERLAQRLQSLHRRRHRLGGRGL